ncbi:hypothetical protein M758_4G110600 [Ceratodon purpureus]|nr:hypothetical protein M758_4G110600 [Ceratodon purpureus]
MGQFCCCMILLSEFIFVAGIRRFGVFGFVDGECNGYSKVMSAGMQCRSWNVLPGSISVCDLGGVDFEVSLV